MSAARDFRDKGFTVARGFFSKDDVASLLAEVERRMSHEDTKDALTEGGLIFTANVFKQSRTVQAFLAQQRLIDFLKPIAGDLIVFSSLMLHRTGPNEADSVRVAYVAEYMPTSDYDYDVAGPYFIAGTNGKSDPHFVRVPPGALSLKNQLMYWRPRARKLIDKARHPLRTLRNALRG